MFTENRSLAKALLVAAFICTLGAWLPVGDGPDLTALYRTKVKKKKKKKRWYPRSGHSVILR